MNAEYIALAVLIILIVYGEFLIPDLYSLYAKHAVSISVIKRRLVYRAVIAATGAIWIFNLGAPAWLIVAHVCFTGVTCIITLLIQDWVHARCPLQAPDQTDNLDSDNPDRAEPAALETTGTRDGELRLSLLAGAGAILFAGFEFWRHSHMEATGATHSIRGLYLLLYTLGGKWLIPLPFVALGIMCIVRGIIQYRKNEY